MSVVKVIRKRDRRKLKVEDLYAIASINRIIRNYRMMKRLLGA